METSDKVLVGAALGTLIGSLTVMMLPKNNALMKSIKSNRKQLFDKTKGAADYLIGEAYNRMPTFRRQNPQKFFWGGSALGVLLGAGTALMLAPRTGKNLRNQLVKTYNQMTDKTQEILNSIHPVSNTDVIHKATRELTKARKKVKAKTNGKVSPHAQSHAHANHTHHRKSH